MSCPLTFSVEAPRTEDHLEAPEAADLLDMENRGILLKHRLKHPLESLPSRKPRCIVLALLLELLSQARKALRVILWVEGHLLAPEGKDEDMVGVLDETRTMVTTWMTDSGRSVENVLSLWVGDLACIVFRGSRSLA